MAKIVLIFPYLSLPKGRGMDHDKVNDILDATFKTLFNNMDQNGLHFEKQILGPNKFRVQPKEIDQLWDVLLASGLADSIIGFGNEGKLEMTPAGIQMMTRFGSYKNFLASMSPGPQLPPQVTIQLSGSDKPAKKPGPKTSPGPRPTKSIRPGKRKGSK